MSARRWQKSGKKRGTDERPNHNQTKGGEPRRLETRNNSNVEDKKESCNPKEESQVKDKNYALHRENLSQPVEISQDFKNIKCESSHTKMNISSAQMSVEAVDTSMEYSDIQNQDSIPEDFDLKKLFENLDFSSKSVILCFENMIETHPDKEFHLNKLRSQAKHQSHTGLSAEAKEFRSSVPVQNSQSLQEGEVFSWYENSEEELMEGACAVNDFKEDRDSSDKLDHGGEDEKNEGSEIDHWKDENCRTHNKNDRGGNEREDRKDRYKRNQERDRQQEDWRRPNQYRNKEQRGEHESREHKKFFSEHRGEHKSRESKLKIVREIEGDLFTAPDDNSLAHCVATDMRMGSGIAVGFKKTFKCVGDLLDQRPRVGHICVLQDKERFIYYLTTKRYSNEKPRFEDLLSSLEKMKEHCAKHNVKKLAMPRIGCGLDRLQWKEVKQAIEDTFSDLDISITVYNFNQTGEEEQKNEKPKENKKLSFTHEHHPLVKIASETALLFFGTEDGDIDDCGKELNDKFNFLYDFRKEKRVIGSVVRIVKRNEVLFGLIIKKKMNDAFSYKTFESCIYKLRILLKKDQFFYVGIQAFRANNDNITMEKIISVFRSVLTIADTAVYICWPEKFSGDHDWSVQSFQ